MKTANENMSSPNYKLKSIDVPPTCLLVTLDVSSLYTNIPHSGDLLAVQ